LVFWFGKTRKTKDTKTGKCVVKPCPREEWMMIPVPAIVTEELFEAVQERREVNKRLLGHQHKHEYTLGGMIRCGECGNGVTGKTGMHKNGTYAYYHCNSRHVPSKYDFRC
jgi:site-specific DNA recombinase